ncbi:MAG: endonuclease/exonuclease/phosphatase family protein [Pseudomonadota bacterium]
MSISFRALGSFFDDQMDTIRIRGKASDDSLSWYVTKPRNAAAEIHGTIKSTAVEPIGLTNHPEKGLAQLTRWRSAADSHRVSLREMSERESSRDSETYNLLVYNTWLIDPPTAVKDPEDRESRIPEIGRAISKSSADIVALSEVFKKKDRRAIERAVEFPVKTERGPGPAGLEISSGLFTLVRASKARIVSRKRMAFEANEGFPDNLAQKGVLLTEIDLGAGSIDLFSTHLNAVNSSTRGKQVGELLRFVAKHRSKRNVTIVVGDFNIDGRKSEYADLLRRMASEGLHDVWLSRGSRLGATVKKSSYDSICRLDHSNDYCRDFSGDDDPLPGTPSDRLPGHRLDYIFIQAPSSDHSFDLDISRVRRRPFWRGHPYPKNSFTHTPQPRSSIHQQRIRAGLAHPITPSLVTNYLSDHLGLEIKLRVTASS